MLNILHILHNPTRLLAIASGTLLLSVNGISVNAQTNVTASTVESWDIQQNINWQFSSEKESLSVEDQLNQLDEYDISDSTNEIDLELVEENRRFDNQADGRDYSIETPVYDY